MLSVGRNCVFSASDTISRTSGGIFRAFKGSRKIGIIQNKSSKFSEKFQMLIIKE